MSIVSPANVGAMVDPVNESHDKQLSQPSSRTASTHVNARAVEVAGKPSFMEYLHWAALRRQVEDADTSIIVSKGITQLFNKEKEKGGNDGVEVNESVIVDDDQFAGLSERERELSDARRMLRQAGWATVFFLVTCDILGPFNAPYSIMSVGIAPGVCLYVLFGAVAAITGMMLCRLFLRLDSVRFPVRTYGDLAERIFGAWARHLCSILQSIQLVLNVGLICLSNGQSLAQVTKYHLCFSVCVVIWAIVGFGLGQIRSLQNYGVIANSSVWLNLLIIFLSMGFVAHSAPNYAAAFSSYGISEGPVLVQAIVHQPLFAQVNGVFNMVFAYGGAMIFPEMLAEMRRPRDFIKGMAMAQILIFSVYLTYGVFVYCFQGQFSLAIAYQGVSKYAWQTIGNVLGLITGIIAAGLYGNIGLKVLYINIIEDLFKGPPMMSPRGRWVWSGLVFVYWSLAFIIASAIPAVGALSGLVAAMCIFQFTYTFPPALMLGFDIKLDAAAADEHFTTPGVKPHQIDSWTSASRWKRGIFGGGSKRTAIKFVNFMFLLAALATAALGMWATGTDLRESIAAGAATSFGCTAPV